MGSVTQQQLLCDMLGFGGPSLREHEQGISSSGPIRGRGVQSSALESQASHVCGQGGYLARALQEFIRLHMFGLAEQSR